jgi:hypothetical protein
MQRENKTPIRKQTDSQQTYQEEEYFSLALITRTG